MHNCAKRDANSTYLRHQNLTYSAIKGYMNEYIDDVGYEKR